MSPDLQPLLDLKIWIHILENRKITLYIPKHISTHERFERFLDFSSLRRLKWNIVDICQTTPPIFLEFCIWKNDTFFHDRQNFLARKIHVDFLDLSDQHFFCFDRSREIFDEIFSMGISLWGEIRIKRPRVQHMHDVRLDLIIFFFDPENVLETELRLGCQRKMLILDAFYSYFD